MLAQWHEEKADRKIMGKSLKFLSCVTLGGGIRLQVLFYSVFSNVSTIKMCLRINK